MSPAQRERFELSSIEVSPDGESFVLGLVTPTHEIHRLEFPCWTIHQLMRLLPRLDAALVQARDHLASDLVAYPVVQWSVERTGADHAVAMSVQDDRQVESAFLLSAEDARAFHTALGETLDGDDDRGWTQGAWPARSAAAA